MELAEATVPDQAPALGTATVPAPAFSIRAKPHALNQRHTEGNPLMRRYLLSCPTELCVCVYLLSRATARRFSRSVPGGMVPKEIFEPVQGEGLHETPPGTLPLNYQHFGFRFSARAFGGGWKRRPGMGPMAYCMGWRLQLSDPRIGGAKAMQAKYYLTTDADGGLMLLERAEDGTFSVVSVEDGSGTHLQAAIDDAMRRESAVPVEAQP